MGQMGGQSNLRPSPNPFTQNPQMMQPQQMNRVLGPNGQVGQMDSSAQQMRMPPQGMIGLGPSPQAMQSQMPQRQINPLTQPMQRPMIPPYNPQQGQNMGGPMLPPGSMPNIPQQQQIQSPYGGGVGPSPQMMSMQGIPSGMQQNLATQQDALRQQIMNRRQYGQD
jgi:hypothetical protein